MPERLEDSFEPEGHKGLRSTHQRQQTSPTRALHAMTPVP
jgi:hypothetical protein